MSQSRTKVRSVSVRSRTPLAQVHPAQRHTKMESLPPHASDPPENQTKPLGFGERMLRNTAVCVALLLTVLAMQSINTPGITGATDFLSQVVSMDLSESLGSLKFVSNLMPESAQVFWNLGAEKYVLPTDADVVHVFNVQEPWTGYAAGEVRASAPGEVMSLAVDAAGRATVRLRHASGMETLYGNLLQVSVQEGDWVETGSLLGAAKLLTYELRQEGRATNPAPYLK